MNIYEQLGVKSIINGVGTVTYLGSTIMAPEVLTAMTEASRSFVELDELLEKAGQRIAELMGVEAAYVTTGAAAGLVLATAACIAGKDQEKIGRLPNTEGMKNEVIIQRAQRNWYDQMILVAGAKLVEIGKSFPPVMTYPWELESSITEKTAAIVYFTAFGIGGSLPLEEVIAIAKRVQIPTIADVAAELPPVSNLSKFIEMGVDLVLFSGGKDIEGPADTGVIAGRKDLIEACAANANPHHGIGRPMKVGKEAIAGLVTALDRYVKQDFEAESRVWEKQVAYLVETLSALPYVNCRRVFPGEAPILPLGIPRAYIDFDSEALGITKQEVLEKLLNGEPRIALWKGGGKALVVNPQTLVLGEERVIAERLQAILQRQI